MTEDMAHTKIAAAIMAGGRSRRMAGRHKGLLLTPQGETFTERILTEMQSFTDLVYISYGDTIQMENLDVGIVRDIYPGGGPISGLHAVLKKAAEDGAEAVAVAACDMPFVKADLYRFLLQTLICRTEEEKETMPGHSVRDLFLSYDGVVPVTGGKIHPLAAIYSIRAVSTFERRLENKELRVREALEQLKILYVEPAGTPYEEMLVNINTEEEYAAYKKAVK